MSDSLPFALNKFEKQLGIEHLENTQTITLTVGDIRKTIEAAWDDGYNVGEDYNVLPQWVQDYMRRIKSPLIVPQI